MSPPLGNITACVKVCVFASALRIQNAVVRNCFSTCWFVSKVEVQVSVFKISESNKWMRQTWEKHSLSVCLKCFRNELNMSARNLFSHHILQETSWKWFMLNSVCHICRLIKWSLALSIHFSVMTFHLILQLSTSQNSIKFQCIEEKLWLKMLV